MVDVAAVVLETLTIIITSNLIYVKKNKLTNYIIILVFSILYGIINQHISNISPVIHYLIYTVMIFFIHIEEKRWVAPFAALVGYAALIYLQTICLRWFSVEWLSANYELAGLVINVIVFAMAMIIYFVMKRLHVDVHYYHLKWWQIVAAICIAAGVIVFCIVYKPILEAQYYIDSYVWLCFVGAVLFAIIIVERQASRVKNKQIIGALQKRVDAESSCRHDYEKELRVLAQTDYAFAEDVLKENEKMLYFERLPEYPRNVIESYLSELREKGIELKLIVPEPVSGWALTFKDTISVLGNLLENAVEAVEPLPEKEKWIEIAFDENPEGRYLQVCISNPFAEEESEKKAVIRRGGSTKGEDRGRGIHIVEKKMKRYGGEARIYVHQQIFTALLDIPDQET